ncbi:hypothetical protein ABZT16_11630 [Streptomyces flaveolus]|uniref:hypothetical protein n=1 Tax=Streptomyces flaveolus TaxID=67297 RepID=UPI0033A3B2FA
MGGPLKKYEVTTPSGVKTTMKLNEADARRLGVLEEPEQDATDEATTEETPSSKARSTRNKSRTAANKDGGAGGGDD